jgi:biotin carboxyl carrier protein
MDTGSEVFLQPERVLISPSGGRVELPVDGARAAEGEFVLAGDRVAGIRQGDGHEVAVRSAFPGWVMGYLVMDGQPIDPGDPVAWLRVV